MKIYDAVFAAALLLGLNDLCAELENGDLKSLDVRGVLSEETSGELDILLRCCNLVLGQLASSDFPLTAKETVRAQGGEINYSDFKHKVKDVVCVTKSGKKISFTEFHDSVAVSADGELKVTYTFSPEKYNLYDDSPYAADKPSALLVSYGIAREYCIISGMAPDAAMWDGRFVAAAAEEARGKRREKRIKPRRWI